MKHYSDNKSKMQNWWYDRTGPRADDEAIEVGFTIIGEILAEMQKTRPALLYKADKQCNGYDMIGCSHLQSLDVYADYISDYDHGFCVNLDCYEDKFSRRLKFKSHKDWARLPKMIDELLRDDAEYQRRVGQLQVSEIQAELRATREAWQQLIPASIRLPLPSDAAPGWSAQQQSLLAAHQALAPDGEGATAVAAHFNSLQL